MGERLSHPCHQLIGKHVLRSPIFHLHHHDAFGVRNGRNYLGLQWNRTRSARPLLRFSLLLLPLAPHPKPALLLLQTPRPLLLPRCQRSSREPSPGRGNLQGLGQNLLSLLHHNPTDPPLQITSRILTPVSTISSPASRP